MTRAEYDRAVPELVRSGLSVAHEGAIGGTRFIYFATDSVPGGLLYEIAEVKEPPIYRTMMKIRDLARVWDGHDPIRDFTPAALKGAFGVCDRHSHRTDGRERPMEHRFRRPLH